MSTSVTKTTTHLVSTEDEVDKMTGKVCDAIKNSTPVVSIAFINGLLAGDTVKEEDYLLHEVRNYNITDVTAKLFYLECVVVLRMKRI